MIKIRKISPALLVSIISIFILNTPFFLGNKTVKAASGATQSQIDNVASSASAIPKGDCTLTRGLTMPTPCKGVFDCTGVDSSTCLKYNPMIQWIRFLVNVLSALIGVFAIIMVTLAGIQYSAAADNPQGVQAAKKRIQNVLIGLVAYIFLYAFLQWLVLGGVV